MKIEMPVVKTKQFILRDITIDDYLDYYEVGADELTTKYLTWGPFRKPVEALWFIENINLCRPYEGLPVGYAVVEPKEKKMIGTIDFHTYFSGQNAAEIGFCLHRSYWNKGIITQALKEMIILGFEHLQLHKIIVGHVRENESSQHVILKNGFRYETTVYNSFVDKKTNELHDVIYYSIYRFEYERGGFKW